jgi:hypothetical protein
MVRLTSNNQTFENQTVSEIQASDLTGCVVNNCTITGSSGTWNGIEYDGVTNCIVINTKTSTTPQMHNRMQIDVRYAVGGYNNVFKNLLSYGSGAGGTCESGCTSYYLTFSQDYSQYFVHDCVLEDCIARDCTQYENGIAMDNCMDITIRRYSSINIANIDILVMGSSNIILIDSVCKNITGYINDWAKPTSHTCDNNKIINSIAPLVGDADHSDFTYYYYLDVKVVDQNGTVIPGAIVSIPAKNYVINVHGLANQMLSFGAINLAGTALDVPLSGNGWSITPQIVLKPQPIISTTTTANGHTPLPNDPLNTLVIPSDRHDSRFSGDNYVTNFSFSVTASKDGYTNTVTVTADSTWLRTDPQVPTITIPIVLPYVITTCPTPTGDMIITTM